MTPDKPQSGDTWYKMEVQCRNELRHLEQRSKMMFQLARQRIFLPRAGCKEIHFYSLQFGQAEANIYQPKRHFN